MTSLGPLYSKSDVSPISETLRRYVEDYGWRWPMVRSLINRRFGTTYTTRQLMGIYESQKLVSNLDTKK